MNKLSPFLRGVYATGAARSAALRPRAINAFTKTIERYNLPVSGWSAKGFEFWTFLSLLLIRSNCTRVLELGSGRSTLVFNEYAKFRNARVTSIETNRQWYNKARMELRWQSLPIDSVHLLKLDRAARWYDVGQFRALTQSENGFDFVLVDGPNEVAGSSRGIRDGDTAVREIGSCSRDADVMIVDDVHRRHVLDSVDRMLSDPGRYEKLFYNYSVQRYPNSLCLCIKKGSPASLALPELGAFLERGLYTAFPRDLCPEE